MNAKTFANLRKNFVPNLWQSLSWSNFQLALNHPVVFLGDDEAIAMVIIKPLLGKLTYAEIPRGPLGITDKNFWQELKQLAKKYHCIYVAISPPHKLFHLPKWHFKNWSQHLPQHTLILDLSLPEHELLKQMKAKGRYNIRLAQRHQVKIIVSNDVAIFYELLNETTDRDKFSGHSLSYYKTMLDSLGDQAQLYLAQIYDEEENKMQTIAGGIFTFVDDTCTYYYGASSNKHREKMAPYLLQWYAITEARKRNFKYYDFLGIAPEDNENHRLAGVSKFKRQFGGQVVSYEPTRDIVYKPFFYLFYFLYKTFTQ